MNLETITPEMFLRPIDHLKTGFPLDGDRAKQVENFKRGFLTGRRAEHVFVAVNNVWSAKTKDGGHLQSYEKLGYHAGTAWFFLGVLKSGCPVTIYRRDKKEGVRIK